MGASSQELARPSKHDVPFADVLVVHRNALLRAGIAAALAPSLLTCDAGRTEVPTWSGRVKPRVLVGDHDGAVQALTRSTSRAQAGNGTEPRWLVVAASMNSRLLRTAMQAGVIGYVHASCELDELREAACSVAAGRRYLCQTAAATLAQGWSGDTLTPREVDVLRMLCLGLDNKSIGLRLHVAPGTIKAHVKTLLHKLSVHNRTQAVVEAFKRGMHDDLAPEHQLVHRQRAERSESAEQLHRHRPPVSGANVAELAEHAGL